MAQFEDAGLVGNGLGGIFLNAFPFSQLAVVSVINFHRADFGAITAIIADSLIDIAGSLFDIGFKVSRCSFQLLQGGKGEDFNVVISGTLNKLGRDDTGCAITGGKGFIQVRHHPADRGRLLDQIDLKPGIG